MNSSVKEKKKARRLVTLDTMVLIWGFRDRAKHNESEDINEKRYRSRVLLEMLNDEDAAVVVPSIVAAELLIPIEENARGEFLSSLENDFICVPFDLKAAAIAAKLWNEHKTFPKDEQYTDRPLLKSDIIVIASAKAAGVSALYSDDSKCRKLATTQLKAHPLPTRHPDMFTNNEIRSNFFPPGSNSKNSV